MPSRVHWVFMSSPGNPRFDHQARAFFQDALRRVAHENMNNRQVDSLALRIGGLSMNFRKAVPELQEIAIDLGFSNLSKRLRKFRLPKKLRKNKNPIFAWRQSA